MTKYFIFFLIFIIACSYQDQFININIENKSDFLIDSVKIHPKVYHNKEMKDKLNYRFYMDPKINEGSAVIFVYSNGKHFVLPCCDYDWGRFFKKEENLYFFNNGITYDSNSIRKPELFTVNLSYSSGIKIDSLYSNFKHEKYFKDNNSVKIIYAFDSLEIDPIINIVSNNKVTKYKIENDWENWNIDQKLLSFNNGIIIEN